MDHGCVFPVYCSSGTWLNLTTYWSTTSDILLNSRIQNSPDLVSVGILMTIPSSLLSHILSSVIFYCDSVRPLPSSLFLPLVSGGAPFPCLSLYFTGFVPYTDWRSLGILVPNYETVGSFFLHWCRWSDTWGIDWSVCLLTFKHLVSLQAPSRTRPLVQVELDLCKYYRR